VCHHHKINIIQHIQTHTNCSIILHHHEVDISAWSHKVDINNNTIISMSTQLVATMLQWMESTHKLGYKWLTSMPTWASFHHEPMPILASSTMHTIMPTITPWIPTISPFGIDGNHMQTRNHHPLFLPLWHQWQGANSIWIGSKNWSKNTRVIHLYMAEI